MIISRYLAKEVYSTLLATTTVLLVIFISNQLVRYLQYAAAGELSSHAITLLLLLKLPSLLSLLLPLSLFLSILIAYGRLYADNEMTVLSTCGFGPNQLLKITLKFSLALFFVVAILALWVTPTVSRYSDQIVAGKASTALEMLFPNRFQAINNGKWIFYVGATSRDKKNLQEVFAAEQPDTAAQPTSSSQPSQANDSQAKPRPSRIVFAKGGYEKTGNDEEQSFLVLTNGYRYEGTPGHKDFKIIKYGEYGLKLQQTTSNWKEDESNESTLSLWQKNNDSKASAELQWRISLPITVLILTLLGCGLNKLKPKNSRYAHILPAAIYYIGYAQLMFLSRAWMKKGLIPPILGMWWVHIIMLALIAFIFFKQSTKHHSKTRTSQTQT